MSSRSPIMWARVRNGRGPRWTAAEPAWLSGSNSDPNAIVPPSVRPRPSGGWLRPEPGDNLGRILVRREHRIEDLLDEPSPQHEGRSSQQRQPLDLERGDRQRPREREVRVAQDLEWEPEPRRHLALV